MSGLSPSSETMLLAAKALRAVLPVRAETSRRRRGNAAAGRMFDVRYHHGALSVLPADVETMVAR